MHTKNETDPAINYDDGQTIKVSETAKVAVDSTLLYYVDMTRQGFKHNLDL